MENQDNLKQDCDCNERCCTPQKKSNRWTKLIFIIIVLAAGAIITVKSVGKHDALPAKCCETPKSSSCCTQPSSSKDSTNCSQPRHKK